MDKLFAFLKKNYLFSIVGAAVLVVVVITGIVLVKKGTFAVDDLNTLSLECSNEPTAAGYVCEVRLNYDTNTYDGENKKIYSANANFNLPSGVSYVGFETVCEECDIAEYTENGFAIGKRAGLANDSIIGRLTVSLPEDVTDATYVIELVNVELSDSDYQMLELSDATGSIVIGDGGDEPPVEPPVNPPVEDIVFDPSLNLDETNMIIYNIPLETKYSELLELIDTDATISLKDKNDEDVTGEDLNDTVIGTNYSLVITFEGSEPYVFKLAVSDDFNGDGKLMNGDFRTFLRLFKADDHELIYRYVGAFNTDVENTSLTNGNLRTFIRRFKAHDESNGE